MTPDRFAALAGAFGSDLERWPEAERAAARRYRAAHPDADAVLAAERDLDGLLLEWAVPPPGPFLPAAIAARVVRRESWLRRMRMWLAGGAAVTALAGGVAAGMALATVAMPSGHASSAFYGLRVLGAPVPGLDAGWNDGAAGDES